MHVEHQTNLVLVRLADTIRAAATGLSPRHAATHAPAGRANTNRCKGDQLHLRTFAVPGGRW